MMQLMRGIRDILYPPECISCRRPTEAAHGLCGTCWAGTPFITGSICDSCGIPMPTAGPGGHCETCDRYPPPWDVARAAALYEGRAREAILRLKHRDRLDLAPVLAQWMARPGRALLDQATLVAPVPLFWTRRLMRRTNQAAELLRHPPFSRSGKVVPDLLLRRRATRSLKGLNREERRTELQGAIIANLNCAAQLEGAHVLLIDDVMTTGATLGAAAEAAHRAGAKTVSALVVARVAKEDFASI